jgi:dienelactone hydrolase
LPRTAEATEIAPAALEFALAAVYVKLLVSGDECLGITAKDGIMSVAIRVRGCEMWLKGRRCAAGHSRQRSLGFSLTQLRGGKMALLTREIVYEADGARMVGYYVADGQRPGRRPGILVSPPGPGLGEHSKAVARRLTEAGYAAFALDYHGGGTVLTDMALMMGRIQHFMQNPLSIRARLQKALEMLIEQPEVDSARVGAIGYCFGGTSVLELARSGAQVATTVGFHSGLKTSRPNDAGNIRGKVLVCLGADDPLIPLEDRNNFEAEMRGGGADWQMHVYGGAQHSFTDPNVDARAQATGMTGLKYDANADRRSWRSMLDLFVESFGTI